MKGIYPPIKYYVFELDSDDNFLVAKNWWR